MQSVESVSHTTPVVAGVVYYPIPCMGLVYLPTFGCFSWLIFMPQDPSGFGIFMTVNGKLTARKKYTNPVDPTVFLNV